MLTLSGPQARLELRFLRLSEGQGGVPSDPEFAVFAKSGTFSGSNPSVCVRRPDWDAFIAALERLEASRSGEAAVAGMSPGELELRIAAIDRLGHMAAVGHVSGYVLNHRFQRITSHVAFEIELEPSSLPELLSAFRSLVPGQARSGE
jgi:hypothetical protein